MENKQPLNGILNSGRPVKSAWGYAESFMVALEIVILGFIFEIVLKGQGVRSPHLPYNLIMFLALIGILIFVHFYFRYKPVVKWLSSVPCSISAISMYALLVLLMGFITQQGENQSRWLQLLGLNHLKNSWPFLLIQIYLLVSLGLVVLRRGIPFHGKNLGFLLNHLGLWITLAAAGLGSGDLKRVSIDLQENGKFNNVGYKPDHSRFEMPFSMKLVDFNIEMYDSKIAVADGSKGEIVQKHGETLPVIHKGYETTLIDWKIKVKQYIPFAFKTDSGYVETDKPGSIAVAFIETRNVVTGDTVSGWITSGSMMFDPKYLDLKKSKLLILTEPEPRKFESLVVVKNARGDEKTVKLEVNKPYRMNGWKLYQISYDTQMGKYSTLSVIEAVRDPWLPLVYSGIFLLLGGAIYLFWLGRGVRSNNESEI
jgi:hypothetical protein